MIIDEKTKRYIKEVYYSNSDELREDFIRLLEGEVSVEQLRQDIADTKDNDEGKYGGDIYKKDPDE